MTKSDTDKRRSKLEDAKTIIGPELAEMLQEAVQRMKSKSEDIELIEKKEDGKTDYPKGEAYKRHMKDGEFDMGDCLTAKKSEGIERKQALAICLSMARKAGADVPPPPKKAELEDDLAEKAQGGSDGEFEMDKCLGRFKKIGFSEEAAKETCDRLAKKWSRQSTTKEVIGRKADLEDDEEDEEMEESNDGCIKAQMDEGKSREEAEKHCAESEAEAEEKADLDAVVDELIAEVLSDDSEVQVVKGDAKEATEADVNDVNVAGISENELALTEALLDVLKENELLKSAVLKSDEEDETPVSDLEVEDVNEPEPTEKGSVSHPLDKYFLTMKSALVDDSLDRSEKAIIINHSFEKMGEIAKEEIEKRTPASPRDQAELLKAALEEVVAPMAGQLDLLVQQVNDLQAEKKAYEKALLAPKSKQLRMTANNQQVAKSETEEPKGALTARQIADLTVSRLNPIRY